MTPQSQSKFIPKMIKTTSSQKRVNNYFTAALFIIDKKKLKCPSTDE